MSRTGGILLAIALAVGLFAAAILTGMIAPETGDKDSQQGYANKGVLEVTCDVEASKPTDGLIPPFETVRLTLPAVFDFDQGTGAYAGEYALSMNRKGTLKVDGEALEVHRQSMFKRHGVVIIGEHVTLNRKTGEFRQWLDLEAEKRLELITGSCKRTDNAPF